jgi:hypothetical protein
MIKKSVKAHSADAVNGVGTVLSDPHAEKIWLGDDIRSIMKVRFWRLRKSSVICSR